MTANGLNDTSALLTISIISVLTPSLPCFGLDLLKYKIPFTTYIHINKKLPCKGTAKKVNYLYNPIHMNLQ
jgi:hypothetical protein